MAQTPFTNQSSDQSTYHFCISNYGFFGHSNIILSSITVEKSTQGADPYLWLLPALNHVIRKDSHAYNRGLCLAVAALFPQGRHGPDLILVALAGRVGNVVGLLRPRP